MAGNVVSFNQESVLANDSDSQEETMEEISSTPTSLIEKLNLGTEKKLLVLDLAGLLCVRVFRGDKDNIPTSREPDAVFGSFLVFKRPYCEEFLNFCFQRFEVGIWSSAKKQNLKDALDCVMGKLISKLLFVWDQDECTDSGFKTMENKYKPIFFKELEKLWEHTETSKLPWSEGKYSPSNTLLIDDKPYKALTNPPYTGIFPSEYKVEHVGDAGLGTGSELQVYLEGVAKADDVPSYVKAHPFGQPAITSEHPDWDFYSKILHSREEEKEEEELKFSYV